MSVLPLQLTPELMTGIPTDDGALPRVNDRAKQLVPTGVPRILLTTTCHLPSTARLAMEFADAGAQVAVLSPADHPALVMTFLSHRLTYHAMRPLRALRVAIERAAPDLVIPCDERAVRHLHQLHALARQHAIRGTIERSLGPSVSFGLTTTRHDLLMLARGQGVRVPDSMKLATVDDLKHWNARHKFPWVLKADGSWAGFGVRVVSSAPAATAAFEVMTRPVSGWLALREMVLEHDLFWLQPWLARARPAMFVQSYIDGWPANCAVACWQGEVLAGIAVEAVTTQSATGPSTVARVIDNPDMLESARRVVHALGITGLVGFDFMIEAATGLPYMIEMNPRSTPICPIRLGPGRDLTEALLARLAGRPVRERPPITERDIIVYFPQTWRQDPTSAFLRTGYHDVPWEQPKLVRALMRPELRERYWATRQLRRLWHKTRLSRQNRENDLP